MKQLELDLAQLTLPQAPREEVFDPAEAYCRVSYERMQVVERECSFTELVVIAEHAGPFQAAASKATYGYEEMRDDMGEGNIRHTLVQAAYCRCAGLVCVISEGADGGIDARPPCGTVDVKSVHAAGRVTLMVRPKKMAKMLRTGHPQWLVLGKTLGHMPATLVGYSSPENLAAQTVNEELLASAHELRAYQLHKVPDDGVLTERGAY